MKNWQLNLADCIMFNFQKGLYKSYDLAHDHVESFAVQTVLYFQKHFIQCSNSLKLRLKLQRSVDMMKSM